MAAAVFERLEDERFARFADGDTWMRCGRWNTVGIGDRLIRHIRWWLVPDPMVFAIGVASVAPLHHRRDFALIGLGQLLRALVADDHDLAVTLEASFIFNIPGTGELP